MTKKRIAGFSLLEVLISLIIVAGGMLALIKFHASVASASVTAKQHSEATLFAQRKMEELRSYASESTYDAYFAGGSPATGSETRTGESATYTISWTMTDTNSTLAGRYAAINLTTAWTDQSNQAQSINLVSRVARMQPLQSGALLMPPATGTTPTSCAAGAVKTWTVSGVSCSGAITNSGTVGSTQIVNATTNTGADQYQCQSDGTWAEVTSYAETCTAQCPAQTASWTGTNGEACSGALTAANAGASGTATDSTTPVTGSATYSCGNNGAWSVSGTPTCTATCPTQSVSWYSGDVVAECSGTLNQTTAINTQTFNNSVANQVTATATYQCNANGTWSNLSSACSSLSATVCPATSKAWTVGSYTCSAPLAQGTNTQATTVSSTDSSYIGSATFTCNAPNWSAATNATCAQACQITVSGLLPATGASVYFDGVQKSCVIAAGSSYACNNINVTSGSSVVVSAKDSSGNAVGITQTISPATCGTNYTNKHLGCFVSASGTLPPTATGVYFNSALGTSCTIGSGTYSCSAIPTTAGSNISVVAKDSSSAAVGQSQTISGATCGSSYANTNLGCYISVSGTWPSNAATLWFGSTNVSSSCTLTSSTYSCTNYPVNSGQSIVISAKKTNGGATGSTQTITATCGSSYTGKNL